MSRIDAVRAAIVEHVSEIAGLFVPGAKITVVVRTPHIPGSEIIVTDDDIRKVAHVLIDQIEPKP